jgi:serine phosphatase RsbU (regulator of sigma subunit)
VQVSRFSASQQFCSAHTVDISRFGARLAGVEESFCLGEFLMIRCGVREATFRVMWIGVANTSTAGQFGVECLTPEMDIWDRDLLTRAGDEPLLQEIAVAQAVQRNLFPREKPALQTLEYAGRCIQARTVGGDYYDFLDLGPGRVGFVLADVAGKGIAAALLMANLQGSIHNHFGLDTTNLPGLLSAVNEHLYHHTEPYRYATLFYGAYDDRTRRLSYVNCGHLPPVVLRANGTIERLEATATVLGLLGEWRCELADTQLAPGDLLSIYTDGVTETTGRDEEEFGEIRLLAALDESKHEKVATMIDRIEEDVRQFRTSDRWQDDLTFVVARAKA